MKLGASYNLFDGEELLESSIKSVRSSVDYISVVYQTVSNFGMPCSPQLENLLKKLKDQKLIDELYKYTPLLNIEKTISTILGRNGSLYLSQRAVMNNDLIPKENNLEKLQKLSKINEITKRNTGLGLSIKNGCTHHISMDADEFYIEKELDYARSKMEEGDYDSSLCSIVTYYKEPIYIINPHVGYSVTLIYKIRPRVKYELFAQFPSVDSTRAMPPGRQIEFSRREIQLHHMNYVRKNIGCKFVNSSGRIKFTGTTDKLIDSYNKWKYPDQALLSYAGGVKYFDVIKIDNIFN